MLGHLLNLWLIALQLCVPFGPQAWLCYVQTGEKARVGQEQAAWVLSSSSCSSPLTDTSSLTLSPPRRQLPALCGHPFAGLGKTDWKEAVIKTFKEGLGIPKTGQDAWQCFGVVCYYTPEHSVGFLQGEDRR